MSQNSYLRSISWFAWVSSLFLIFPVYGKATINESEDPKQFFVSMKSVNINERIDTLMHITTAAVIDKSLLGYLESTLKASYRTDPSDEAKIDELSWMCKALASSGDSAYLGVLKEVEISAPSKKLKEYAKDSSARFQENTKRSNTLNRLSDDTGNTDRRNRRLINMLRSEDSALQFEAAREIAGFSMFTIPGAGVDIFPQVEPYLVFSNKSELLYFTLNSELLKLTDKRVDNVNTLVLMSMALTTSKDKRYLDTLNKVADIQTWHFKLKKYAQSCIDCLKTGCDVIALTR